MLNLGDIPSSNEPVYRAAVNRIIEPVYCNVVNNVEEAIESIEKKDWEKFSGIFHENDKDIVYHFDGLFITLSFGEIVSDDTSNLDPRLEGRVLSASPLVIVIKNRIIKFKDCSFLNPTIVVNKNTDSRYLHKSAKHDIIRDFVNR